MPVAAISFLILGVLVAADLNLSQKLFASIVIAVGFVQGVFNGVALKEGAGILGLIGIMATLFVQNGGRWCETGDGETGDVGEKFPRRNGGRW